MRFGLIAAVAISAAALAGCSSTTTGHETAAADAVTASSSAPGTAKAGSPVAATTTVAAGPEWCPDFLSAVDEYKQLNPNGTREDVRKWLIQTLPSSDDWATQSPAEHQQAIDRVNWAAKHC